MKRGEPVSSGRYRAHAMLSVGLVSAMAVHAVYVLLFAWFGVPEMIWANFTVSFPLYLLALLLTRRGLFVAAVTLATVELCIHQALAVHFIGWEAGLQYYLMVLPAVVFLVTGRVVLRLVLVAFSAVVFLLLMVWAHDHPPVYRLVPFILEWSNRVNVLTTFGLLAFFAYNYARAAEVAEERLLTEFRRAEELLHNILPVPIAERLKRAEGTIADGHAGASVLFADIVGFTRLSQEVSPGRLVAILNSVFSEFDDLVTLRGLEKIKTIGDAYMVAAGIPEPRPDHAPALAALALEMLGVMERKARELGLPLQMRIGINSGPVVAGVIGRRKFVYDLWGDAVNTAARMESHGVAGRIQITEATRLLLGDEWPCEARGEIEIKGKGPMEVHLLLPR